MVGYDNIIALEFVHGARETPHQLTYGLIGDDVLDVEGEFLSRQLGLENLLTHVPQFLLQREVLQLRAVAVHVMVDKLLLHGV